MNKSVKITRQDVSYIMFYPSDIDYNIFKTMPHVYVVDEGKETEYLVFYTIPESKVAELLD